MLQALSLEDKRIKVIDQINSGVSQARNNGLKNASGKYIGFVDGYYIIYCYFCTK